MATTIPDGSVSNERSYEDFNKEAPEYLVTKEFLIEEILVLEKE